MKRYSKGNVFGTWIRKRVIGVTHGVRRQVLARTVKFPPPSIFSFDCVGGIVSHELRLPFLSPTVNLFFDSHDGFIDYLSHLAYYVGVAVTPCGYGQENGRPYPIGVLPGNGIYPDVTIHFLHYPSFEVAAAKWQERTRRIHFDRICVIMQVERPDCRLMERFAALPYAHKVVLTYEACEAPFVFHIRWLDHFVPGRLLDYRGLLGRRYLDEFDYPAFLRDGVIRRRE